MNVATFLRQAFAPTFFEDSSSLVVINCVGKAYPLSFFMQFFARWKELGVVPLVFDCTTGALDQFFNELHMSFLGDSKIYWCKNNEDLDADGSKKLAAFLRTYRGPHKIIVFTAETLTDNSDFIISVNCDELITREAYQELFMLLFLPASVTSDTAFTQSLFGQLKNNLSLDQACMMMQYHVVAGGRDKEVCSEWLDRLIMQPHSFFTLSQYFFARDQKSFMSMWADLQHLYPPEFWISYWSEQLWQAVVFVMRLQEVDLATARKSVSRLPFSFLQKDYKLYQLRELVVAHNQIYMIDYGLKNGYASFGLELFFLQFFQGTFAKK